MWIESSPGSKTPWLADVGAIAVFGSSQTAPASPEWLEAEEVGASLASPEFTLHRYAHVMPGMQRDAADTIARAVLHES